MKFPKLVIDEAIALTKYATEQEIGKLDFLTFDPQGAKSCIYGQMTGNCYSARAEELIKKCAKRVYTAGEGFPHENRGLNGSPIGLVRKPSFEVKYWSPIEVFISKHAMKTDIHKKLISFIKGEIKTLA